MGGWHFNKEGAAKAAEFHETKRRLERQEKATVIHRFTVQDMIQEGLLFDIYTHHTVANEANKAAGKRHTVAAVIKAMS